VAWVGKKLHQAAGADGLHEKVVVGGLEFGEKPMAVRLPVRLGVVASESTSREQRVKYIGKAPGGQGCAKLCIVAEGHFGSDQKKTYFFYFEEVAAAPPCLKQFSCNIGSL